MAKKTKKKPTSLRSKVDECFGKPQLLNGEDRQPYYLLRRKLTEMHKPEDFYEALMVQEITDKLWEGQRFQKLGTVVINAECRRAITYLMDPSRGYVSERIAEVFEKSDGKQFPDGMSEEEFLTKNGLSPAVIQATAILMAEKKYSVLDRLATSRVVQRKALISDYENLKSSRQKEKGLAQVDLQRGSLSNDNRLAEPETLKRTKSTL